MRLFFTTLRCKICPHLAFVGDPHESGSTGIINPRSPDSTYTKYQTDVLFVCAYLCVCRFTYTYTYTYFLTFLTDGFMLFFMQCCSVLDEFRLQPSQNMRRFFPTLRCTTCPQLACVGDPNEWRVERNNKPRPPDGIYKKYQMDVLFVCAYSCVCRFPCRYTYTYFSYRPNRWFYVVLHVVLLFSGCLSPLSGVKICTVSLPRSDVQFAQNWLVWGTPHEGGSTGIINPRPPDSIYKQYQTDVLCARAYLCVCRFTYTYAYTYFSYLPNRWFYVVIHVVLLRSG